MWKEENDVTVLSFMYFILDRTIEQILPCLRWRSKDEENKHAVFVPLHI